MENESRISQALRNISGKIQDQVWFQQLKIKWDELDGRTKVALKYIGLIGGSVLAVGLVGTNLYTVAEKKHDIDERLSLISKIQSSQDELRRLKDVSSRFNTGDDQPWGEFIQSKATPAGFASASIQITSEKVVGATADAKDAKSSKDQKSAPVISGPEETIIEATVKRINVRHLVKLVHEVENGGRTVKVRRLQIDTSPDESGYLDATLIVSAFKLKQ